MLFENADISTTVINGRIESLYIIFRMDVIERGEVAKETLKFELDDGSEMFVDVDRHDAVLAVQLLSLDGDETAVVEEIRGRLPELHATASAMVVAYRVKSGNIKLTDPGDSGKKPTDWGA